MRARRFLVTALTLMAGAMALPAQAELYKWVDENGVTRYSETPPAGAATERVQPARPPAAPQSDEEKTAETQAEKDAEDTARVAKQRAEQEAELARKRQELCERAQAELKKLSERPPYRIATVDENGQVSRMSEEQYYAHREKTQAVADENCR